MYWDKFFVVKKQAMLWPRWSRNWWRVGQWQRSTARRIRLPRLVSLGFVFRQFFDVVIRSEKAERFGHSRRRHFVQFVLCLLNKNAIVFILSKSWNSVLLPYPIPSRYSVPGAVRWASSPGQNRLSQFATQAPEIPSAFYARAPSRSVYPIHHQ